MKEEIKKIIFPVLTGLTALIGFLCGFIAIILNTNVVSDITFGLALSFVICCVNIFFFVGIHMRRIISNFRYQADLKEERLISNEEIDVGIAKITKAGDDPSGRIILIIGMFFVLFTLFSFMIILNYLGKSDSIINVILSASVVFPGASLLGYIFAEKCPKFIDKHSIHL